MSRESIGVSVFLASACAAGAVALGFAAESQFSKAEPWERVENWATTEIAEHYTYPQPNHASAPSPVPSHSVLPRDELEYQKNRADGRAVGYDFWGWASVVGAFACSVGALDRSWNVVTIVKNRRREEDEPRSGRTPEA